MYVYLLTKKRPIYSIYWRKVKFELFYFYSCFTSFLTFVHYALTRTTNGKQFLTATCIINIFFTGKKPSTKKKEEKTIKFRV